MSGPGFREEQSRIHIKERLKQSQTSLFLEDQLMNCRANFLLTSRQIFSPEKRVEYDTIRKIIKISGQVPPSKIVGIFMNRI